jgi:hypothetical protein
MVKIAHIGRGLRRPEGEIAALGYDYWTEVSNSDQLFRLAWAIITVRDEHFFSLFQIL